MPVKPSPVIGIGCLVRIAPEQGNLIAARYFDCGSQVRPWGSLVYMLLQEIEQHVVRVNQRIYITDLDC